MPKKRACNFTGPFIFIDREYFISFSVVAPRPELPSELPSLPTRTNYSDHGRCYGIRRISRTLHESPSDAEDHGSPRSSVSSCAFPGGRRRTRMCGAWRRWQRVCRGLFCDMLRSLLKVHRRHRSHFSAGAPCGIFCNQLQPYHSSGACDTACTAGPCDGRHGTWNS